MAGERKRTKPLTLPLDGEMSGREFAEMAGLSSRALAEMRKRGEISAEWRGLGGSNVGAWYYHRDELSDASIRASIERARFRSEYRWGDSVRPRDKEIEALRAQVAKLEAEKEVLMNVIERLTPPR